MPRFKPLKDRFWNKVFKTETCWIWKAATDNFGYGRVGIYRPRSVAPAHRVAWILSGKEEIPKGMDLCHSCDNPPCVNPSHLFIGTRQDNVDDCRKKGRMSVGEKHKRIMSHVAVRGSKHYKSKITENDVELIRKWDGYLTQERIAKRFGITRAAVSAIIIRRTWKHI
jgi:hypothetical protein